METTIKVTPQDSEAILQLAQQIVTCHLQNGAESPLKIHHVAEINAKASSAQLKHEEGLKFLRYAQEMFKERDNILGLHRTEFTSHNILYHIQSVQDTLLNANLDEEELAKWGFAGE
jgi:hypothetical protein